MRASSQLIPILPMLSVLPSKTVLAFAAFAVTGIVAAVFLVAWPSDSSSLPPFDLSDASYVGQASCVKCHQKEAELYNGSHHDRAMKPATAESVRGDFADATVEHHDIVSRMFRDGDKFMVHTEGPDGKMHDFEVKYVFGYEPLQQYMVEFPESGQSTGERDVPRVQVLRLCWDTEKSEWFYLAPPDVSEKLAPTDDLHWTGIAQRWNNMCAECHSTDYRKEFKPGKFELDKLPHYVATNADVQADPQATDHSIGEYHSTFMEINVSCEACHGPGSVHVDLASKTFPGWNRERGYGLANLKLAAENQIQACAPCHSRRNVVHGGFQAGDNFYDHYTNQLLTENIYYPDGQILDEDYVHGSFIQSKMYHKGIKCSDCHDPHTAKLKHDGNQVCTSCHQHPAAKYDTVGHHFHKVGSEGAKCVNCHMPATTYMAVDSRRDHSFRIPRPDLSSQLGTPNACTGCHLSKENVAEEKRGKLKLYQDWMLAAREGDEEVQAELERANQWCDEACEKWYGENRRRDQHFGIAISAAQQGKPEAKELLTELLKKRGYEAPYIARATALQYLSQLDPEAGAEMAVRGIKDDHPLVRATATASLARGENVKKNTKLLQAALQDPVRSVRSEAARNLLEFPPNMWENPGARGFSEALKELKSGLDFNNDRAGAHLALGILSEQMQKVQDAVRNYERAIAVEPGVTGPRTNLAALLDRQLNEMDPSSETARKIKGITTKLRKQELPLLQRDADFVPDVAPLQYQLGMAYYVDGQMEQAMNCFKRAAKLDPTQASYAQATAMMYEKLENWDEALRWAKLTVQLSRGDRGNVQLLQRIQQAAAAAKQP